MMTSVVLHLINYCTAHGRPRIGVPVRLPSLQAFLLHGIPCKTRETYLLYKKRFFDLAYGTSNRFLHRLRQCNYGDILYMKFSYGRRGQMQHVTWGGSRFLYSGNQSLI